MFLLVDTGLDEYLELEPKEAVTERVTLNIVVNFFENIPSLTVTALNYWKSGRREFAAIYSLIGSGLGFLFSWLELATQFPGIKNRITKYICSFSFIVLTVGYGVFFALTFKNVNDWFAP